MRRRAQRGLRPADHRFTGSFAAGVDGAQLDVPRLQFPFVARLVVLAHHLEYRGRQKHVANLVARHQFKGAFDVELAAAAGDYRHAVIPARQQHVEQAAGPGPVGGRPEAVARLRKALMHELHRRHPPGHHAMCMQRTLGRAGGAGGEDQEGRVFGAGRHWFELFGLGGEQGGVVEHPGRIGGVGAHEVGERRQFLLHFEQLVEAHRIGQHHAHPRTAQAVFERFGAEQRGHRQHDGAQLVDRQMGGGGFGPLRHHNADAVAARYPKPP